MPNVSVALYQKTSKTKADGTAPVYARVTANRKTRLIATGVYVEPKYWNKAKGQVRAGHDIADALNAKLKKALNEAREAALSATSASAVKLTIDGPGGSFTAYFESFNDRLRARGGRGHWELLKYSSTLTKLRAALGQEVAWAELDGDALRRFERYCREKCENNPNTVRKELTRLHRVVKEAVRDSVVPPAADPFLVYQMPKGQRVERRKLPLADIDKIAALGVDDGVAPGSGEAVTRDAFVFSFYAGGMRFGDVVRLKASDVRDGRAEYRMMKTGTPMSVPLPAAGLEIVSRYTSTAVNRGGFLFPVLRPGDEADGVTVRRRISSKNVVVNKQLKRLAAKAGLGPDGLTFHVARHSFADHARTKSGDLYAISKSLGHGNLSTTETYLKSFDVDAVDSLAEALWS